MQNIPTLTNLNLQDAEKQLVEAALRETGSIVGAAPLLGTTRHGVKRRIIKHGIRTVREGNRLVVAPGPKGQVDMGKKPKVVAPDDGKQGATRYALVTQGALFGASGRTDSPEVLVSLEVDYTPVAVAVQLLLAFGIEFVIHRPRVLDLAAGSGSWSRAARACLPGCYIVGVDARESERANLEAACDEVFIGTFAEFLATNPAPFDLIIGNPPFSAFSEHFWPGLILAHGLLRQGGTLGLYGLTQWGQSATGSVHLRKWAPSKQYRVGGRVEHRGEGTQRLAKIPKSRRVKDGPTHELRDNGGDSREYCAWVWHLEDFDLSFERRRPSWICEQLLELPGPWRKWSPTAVPGTYPVDQALVDEIRTRYL